RWADRHDGMDPRVVDSVDQRHRRAKGMADECELLGIDAWLRQQEPDGARQIERLQPAVGLIALALPNTAEVEAQGDEASHRCILGHLPHEAILHRAGRWLWMADNDASA